jgi:hypothetical protein
LIRTEELTEDTLLSNIESIEALFQEEDEVSLDMAFTAVEVLDEVITRSSSFFLSSSSLERLVPPLDILLKIFLGNELSTARVHDLVDSLAYLIATDITVGEDIRNLTGTFIRIQFNGVELSNADALTLQSARTKYEESLELPVSSISFSSAKFNSFLEIIGWTTSINASSILTAEGRRIYNSEILSVRSIYSTSKTQAIKIFDRQEFTMEILNSERVIYSVQDEVPHTYTITTVCDDRNISDERVLTCPGTGYQETVSCASVGTYAFTCPGRTRYEEPTCALVDEVSRSDYTAAECNLVSFDEFKTVCSCNIDKITERTHATRSVPREMEMASVTELKLNVDSLSGASVDFTPATPIVTFVAGTLGNQISSSIAMFIILCLSIAYFMEYSHTESLFKKPSTTGVVVPQAAGKVKENSFPSIVEHGVGNLTCAGELVEKALPRMYHVSEEFSSWDTFWNEMSKHHKWAAFAEMGSFISGSHENVSGFGFCVGIVSLAVDIVTTIAVLTVVYVVYDDSNQWSNNTCQENINAGNCTVAYVADWHVLGDVCEWRESDSSCAMRTPSSGIWSVFVASCVAAVLSAPLSTCMRWLMHEYCMAATDRGELHEYKNTGLMRLVPSFVTEWIIRNQTVSSFGSTFRTLRAYGLNEEVLSAMKSSKSDSVYLMQKVEEHGNSLQNSEEKDLFLESWGQERSGTYALDLDASGGSDDRSVYSETDEVSGGDGMFSFLFKSADTSDVILNDLFRANIGAMKEQRAILENLQHTNEPLEADDFRRRTCLRIDYGKVLL